MIGRLPKTLNVGGIQRDIRTDYRDALVIFTAYNDVELTNDEKTQVMLECLYIDFNDIDPQYYSEAIEKGVWFLDGGTMFVDKSVQSKKVMDWEQDEQLIFPAINKVAGFETRAVEYMHLWTFLGFFCEIGEGLFSTVLSIRQKKNKGRKLEKHEEEFYRENKHLIDIEAKLTEQEQAEKDYWNKILG